MDLHKVLDILKICIPVFGLIGVGKLLQRLGVLKDEHRAPLNSIVYYLSLPSLVFCAVVVQHPPSLLNPALITAAVVPTLIVAAFYAAAARISGVRGERAAACTFGAFWANLAYMGFPLARNAFGPEQGLALAAVVNTVAMPTFIVLAMFLIGVMGPGSGRSVGSSLRNAVYNPVIIAAILAVIIGLLRDGVGLGAGHGPVSSALAWLASTVYSFLNLLGAMGLPLALISVGAAISLGPIRENRCLLAFSLAGKLVLLPLLAWAVITIGFPGADRAGRGVAVLLMAMPNAVSSYVISNRMGVQPGFTGAMVAISTMFSVVTIPVWLYVVL